MTRRSPNLRRIVVKIGSAVLAPEGVLDPGAVARIAADIGRVLDDEPQRRVVVVSSGAVASGFRGLSLARPPKTIVDKQAAAAIGQPTLMRCWAEGFAANSRARGVAQVLLTAADIDHRQRYLNARHTLERLLECADPRVVPIINENDSVAFDEIKLGDNDHLSSLVASLLSADALVMLSSTPGLLERKTKRVVPVVRGGDAGGFDEAMSHVETNKTSTGTGGMATKLRAACTAAELGIAAVIADGRREGIVSEVVGALVEGRQPPGTLFTPRGRERGAGGRKRWIGYSARAKGSIVVDDGAARAISEKNASLLPSGVVEVRGHFDQGAPVELLTRDGRVIARGLASYASTDAAKIAGAKTSQIASILGSMYAEEIVHRNDLVILSGSAAAKGGSR